MVELGFPAGLLLAALALPQEGQDEPWVVYEAGAGPGAGRNVVLIAGEEEYRSEEALPMLARILAVHHGFRCTVLFSTDPESGTIDPDAQTEIPGLAQVDDADLLVLALRFRELPDEDMAHIVRYVEAGKPVIGLRTSTHAFHYERRPESPYARYGWSSKDWPGGFGRQVLGETWVAHHGAHGSQSTRGVIQADARDHPILRGVTDVWGPTDVYAVRELPDDATVLLRGRVLDGMTPDSPPAGGELAEPLMPVVWTRERATRAGSQRVVCSTLGAAVDFRSADLRRLFVNACYWALGMEAEISPTASVEPVGPYEPSPFGFGGFRKGVRAADHALSRSTRIPIREVLAVESLGVRRRSALYTDALEAELARGAWSAPAEGDAIRSATGEDRVWARFEAGGDGWFTGAPFRGGWAFATVDVPQTGPWILDASGHSSVLVDGELRAGDVYKLGIARAPLALEAGRHELLFRCGRGNLRAALEPAPATVYLEETDRTLPDVLRGAGGTLLAGVVVANAGASAARGYTVLAEVEEGPATRTPLPALLPSSYRKCAVGIAVPPEPAGDQVAVRLVLADAEGTPVHASSLTLAVRDPGEKHARTFASEIDGSVQYFAVVPAVGAPEGERPALFLSLHGAGVEARGQAACYAPRDWGVLVAPTNRRPYGFDWEDWGRLDALEVLALAEELFGTDPRRTYLTGHSMGGHGTWQIGAHFPGRFAAIAPSAGWRDFWGYAGGGPIDAEDPVGALLARAVDASRTLLLERNYAHAGVYVLHGDADDNVPVTEARAMRERLGAFHPDFAYYERPGAGHWWGNACVDWPPLFEFLRDHVLPEPAGVRDVDFVTVSPGISSRCDWVTVEAQEHWMEPTRVHAHLDPSARTIELDGENVARVSFDLSAFAAPREDGEPVLAAGAPVTLHAGEEELALAFDDPDAPLCVETAGGAWRVAGRPDPSSKGPRRAGPFKDAFRHRMVFVYGTTGSADENAWSRAKARYDQETWRYRGNGDVELIADVDFRPGGFADRGVVLYGNRDTNAAWAALLDGAAFDLDRAHVRVGARTLAGDDLALLALYPRRDSDVACVAVVGGTGLAGCRTTNELPYFVSGVAYPDWTVIGADFLTTGLAGVRGAGFFTGDWKAGEGADEAWR